MSSGGSKRRKLSPINAKQCSGGEVDGGTLTDNVEVDRPAADINSDAILDFFTSAGNDGSDVLRDVMIELHWSQSQQLIRFLFRLRMGKLFQISPRLSMHFTRITPRTGKQPLAFAQLKRTRWPTHRSDSICRQK